MRKIPTIGYPGGKARMAKLICDLFPKTGRMFVEPFAGAGNIFWRAASELQYESWWLNDISTAPFFEAIREIGDTVDIPERSKDEYYRQWELYKQGDKRSIILQPFLTFGGGGYGSAGPGGGKGATPEGYKTTIRQCHQLLTTRNVRITSVDFVQMGLENLTDQDAVYLDPPYFEADVRAYKPGTVDFTYMINTLKTAKFRWVLSEFEQPMYLEAFGQPCIKKDVQLASTNKKTRDGNERRIECIWKNF